MILTAEQIYDKLVNEQQILSSVGQITFHLLDVNIIRCYRKHYTRMV